MQDTRKKNRTARPGRREDVYEAQQQSRARTQKRHKRKRRRSYLALYLTVLVVMLAVGLVLIFTVFFKVLTIETEGLTRYDEDQVIASSGIVEGVNLFRINRSAVEEKLVQDYSYFESVHLRYKLPDQVTIQVTEAEPVGAIRQGETFLLISDAGRVLESAVIDPPSQVVQIKGFNALSIEAGDTLWGMIERMQKSAEKAAVIESGDTAETRAAKTATKQANDQVISNIKSRVTMLDAYFAAARETGFDGATVIDLSDQFNLIANLGDGIVVEFGSEAELAYKMQMVQAVLAKQAEGFEGKIDASKPGRAGVRRMSREEMEMTPEEYAEYLYEQAADAAPENGEEAEPPAEETVPSSQEEPSASSEDEPPSQAEPESSQEEPVDGLDSQGLPEID